MKSHLLPAILISFTALAHAGETDPKMVAPPTPIVTSEAWQFSLSLPAWVTWQTGESSFYGRTANIDLGPDDIVPRIDMAADIRVEAHKGRFSVLGEFLYLSLSDGIGTNTIVKKVDLQIDQTMGDLGFAWRVIDTPRGFLDLIGGVRYNKYQQHAQLQANDERIDTVAGQLATAGTLLRLQLAKELLILSGRNPTLPIGPITGEQAELLTKAIAKIQGNTAVRKEKIATLLRDTLNRSLDRTDEWFDPYIGLRGRYNLSDKYYLSAKGDIGGFGVGSELSWTAEAAFGIQLAPHVFSEIGYRAIGVDYSEDIFAMDTITHGVQATLGFTF